MAKKNQQKSRPAGIQHGECYMYEKKIPAGAVEETHKEKVVIIADSETTGNHHVVDLVPGIKFFKHEGKRYMRNEVPATIRCVLESRHSPLTLPPGEYEVGIAQEFDYFAMARRNVAD